MIMLIIVHMFYCSIITFHSKTKRFINILIACNLVIDSVTCNTVNYYTAYMNDIF